MVGENTDGHCEGSRNDCLQGEECNAGKNEACDVHGYHRRNFAVDAGEGNYSYVESGDEVEGKENEEERDRISKRFTVDDGQEWRYAQSRSDHRGEHEA